MYSPNKPENKMGTIQWTLQDDQHPHIQLYQASGSGTYALTKDMSTSRTLHCVSDSFSVDTVPVASLHHLTKQADRDDHSSSGRICQCAS